MAGFPTIQPDRFACRRRTASGWTSINEVLYKGEIGLESDTGLFKFGDGLTVWNSLPYANEAQEAADVPYDNTASGLTATDVQAALDELATGVGVADGDYGDISVSGSGSAWAIDANAVTTAKVANDAITYAKIQNVSATDKLLGRSTSGAGDVEEITCTAAARALLDDTTAAAMRSTLGITSGGAIGTSGQAFAKWDFFEHGLVLSSLTGTGYVTTGIVPVGYFSNGSLSLIDGEAGHPGIAKAETGNSAGGYMRCCFTSGNRIILGGGEIRIVAQIRIPVLSTSSQRFEVSMALQNGITGVTRLLDLRYKDDVNSGNWHMRCIDSGGTTTVNGATAPTANAWTRVELVINAAGTSVEAFVDNVSQGTSTTNIPNADSLAFFMSINKSVGATTSLLHIDYVEITQTFTTPR